MNNLDLILIITFLVAMEASLTLALFMAWTAKASIWAWSIGLILAMNTWTLWSIFTNWELMFPA